MKVPLFCWLHHFLDSMAEICQNFRGFFGKSKGHSEINWPLADFIVQSSTQRNLGPNFQYGLAVLVLLGSKVKFLQFYPTLEGSAFMK